MLRVRGLRVVFRTPLGLKTVLPAMDLDLAAGEVLGIMGESGCGKTVLSLSILGALGVLPGVVGGEVMYDIDGERFDLLEGMGAHFPSDPARITNRQAVRWQRLLARRAAPLRGRRVALLHQNSPQALNPLWRVGRSIGEAVRRAHPDWDGRKVENRALELLEALLLAEPSRVMGLYPWEISVGMAKRVALAAVLGLEPMMMIVDEPTTGLDLTVQVEVLGMLKDLQARTGMALIFISHEIDLLSHIADRVMVVREGRTVEQGPWERFFGAPFTGNAYVRGLLSP